MGENEGEAAGVRGSRTSQETGGPDLIVMGESKSE